MRRDAMPHFNAGLLVAFLRAPEKPADTEGALDQAGISGRRCAGGPLDAGVAPSLIFFFLCLGRNGCDCVGVVHSSACHSGAEKNMTVTLGTRCVRRIYQRCAFKNNASRRSVSCR